jgi:hypothetical protein
VYNESLNDTNVGWYIVRLEGREGLDGRLMGKCVGFLEGYLVKVPITNGMNLFKDHLGVRGTPGIPGMLNFYSDYLEWLQQMIDATPNSLYWRQIGVLKAMFDGLYAGYNAGAPYDVTATEPEFFSYVAEGDSEDLWGELSWTAHDYSDDDHCTAVIRLTDDRRDVYFSHVSWSDYRQLHSVLKHYHLPCGEFAKSPRVSLSTQIGLLSSVDDYYITQAGLLILETTIGVANNSLYHDYVTHRSVMNWMRSLLAAFTSQNVTEWTDQFLTHNSGTYNNEYYVLDAKLLQGNDRVPSNLLYYVLQIPGPFRFVDDLTDELYDEGFVASFNTIKNEAAVNFTMWYTRIGAGPRGCLYHQCARYLIIKREAPRLNDFDVFRKFLRYSDYARDTFSLYEGVHHFANTISARDDTSNLTTNPCHGGLNAKAAKASEVITRMRFHGVNSPSDDPWGPFDWNAPSLAGVPYHDGLPDIFNSGWIQTESPGFDFCAGRAEENCTATNFCGWCGSAEQCWPGNLNAPFFGVVCKRRWKAIGSKDWLLVKILVPIAAAIVIAVITGIVLWRRQKNVASVEILNH